MKRFIPLLFSALLLPAAMAQAEDACVAPGILIAEDPVGDAAHGLGGTEGTGLPFSDIEFLHVAEPASLQDRLVFTLKVVSLDPLPPAHRWVVYFTLPDGVEWYAAMSTADGELPGFEYGKTAILDTPAAAVGQFTYVGDLDPSSSINADGTISLVLDTTAVGLKPGDLADFIYSKVRRSTTSEASNMGLTLDDTGSGGFYTLGGNANCSAGKRGLLGAAGSFTLPGALTLLALSALGLFRRRQFVR